MITFSWMSCCDEAASCLICNHTDFSSYTSPHSFHRGLKVCMHGDGRSATASPHCLPGVHPYHCSLLLSPLVSMQTLPWYRSPLHRSTNTTTPPTPPGSGRGRRSTHLLVEEADRWTATQREQARASGQEFWRERQTKDEEGTKTGGCGGCMWGLKKGRRRRRRRFIECSDTS